MSRRAPTRVLAAERAALVVIVGVFLLPVAWLITTAYKPGRDIFSFPPTFAFTPTLDNFRGVFRYFDLYHLVQSSLIITLGSVALSLLIGIPAGYALARSRSRYAVGVAYFFLAIRTVPPIATLIPFYLMMRDIGLLGTWWAVDPHQRDAELRLRRLDDVFLFPLAAEGAGGSGADRRLHAHRHVLPRGAAARRFPASSRARSSA